MEHDTIADDVAHEAGENEPELIEHALIEDELLVEEISIDGMCGVY
ncbi:MAG TPA: mycofactocin precursor MftA [Ilumatobacteraceae bacterium]|nr:mycofactocin precursor MftA [Ilumatobacteraceae bacterium]